MLRSVVKLVLSGAAATLCAGSAAAQSPTAPAARAEPAAEPPTATYWVYVGAESADLIHRVKFGPEGATVEKTTAVGLYPTEMEGPHGLAISADGRFLHMTTGHGMPDGAYWKIELGPDTVVGEPLPLGPFPATLDLTPDGLYAFIVNFNLHGEMVPSTVSVVYTPDNVEVARVETCTMPHGSRLNPLGTLQYSACMMDDQIVEIDTRSLAVARRFSVVRGAESATVHTGDMADMHADHAGQTAMAHAPTCSPTWAEPAPDGRHIYVACNRSDEVLEIDARDWKLSRRFSTGRGPYNLAVSADGRQLVVTLKQGHAVQIFDIAAGTATATVPASTTVVHGVTISPDSRYAFISVEGVGAEPGRVDIIDLKAHVTVASVEVGQQASGIAFWRMQ